MFVSPPVVVVYFVAAHLVVAIPFNIHYLVVELAFDYFSRIALVLEQLDDIRL